MVSLTKALGHAIFIYIISLMFNYITTLQHYSLDNITLKRSITLKPKLFGFGDMCELMYEICQLSFCW